MKWFIFSVLILFVYSNACFSQPKLEIVGGETHDWKKVKVKDSPLQAKVKLTNVGKEKLVIMSVKPTCGCTTAPLDKTDLQPGDTATLDVKVNISPRSGPIVKTIRIASNDASSPEKVLNLKADVYQAIDILPTQYFSFNEMKVGTESTSKVTIKNSSDMDITFSDIELTPANMEVNVKGSKTLKPGEEFDLVIKVKPDKKGYFNCNVKMKTTHPDFKEIAISGYGVAGESAIFNDK